MMKRKSDRGSPESAWAFIHHSMEGGRGICLAEIIQTTSPLLLPMLTEEETERNTGLSHCVRCMVHLAQSLVSDASEEEVRTLQ